MRILSMEGKKILELEDGRWLQLEYYLTEDENESLEDRLYGMAIISIDGDVVDMECVEKVSYSKDQVIGMLETLMTYSVTPITMLDVVDEMVTLRMCS